MGGAEEERSAQVRRLPVLWVVANAVSALHRHGRELLRAMIVPLLVFQGGLLLSAFLNERGSSFTQFAYQARLIAFPLFAVRWHRLVIRGDTVESAWPRIDSAYFVYSTWAAAGYTLNFAWDLTTAWIVTNEMSSFAIASGSIAVQLTLFVALLRLELVLPAVSVGDSPSLAHAWRVGRGNTWRLFFVTSLVAIVFTLPLLPLAIFYDSPNDALSRHFASPDVGVRFLARLAQSVLWVILVAMQTGAVSFAYRYLTTDEVATYPALPRLSD